MRTVAVFWPAAYPAARRQALRTAQLRPAMAPFEVPCDAAANARWVQKKMRPRSGAATDGDRLGAHDRDGGLIRRRRTLGPHHYADMTVRVIHKPLAWLRPIDLAASHLAAGNVRPTARCTRSGESSPRVPVAIRRDVASRIATVSVAVTRITGAFIVSRSRWRSPLGRSRMALGKMALEKTALAMPGSVSTC